MLDDQERAFAGGFHQTSHLKREALLGRLREAEEELREANQRLTLAQREVELERRRYRDLFESSPEGYLITDLQGVIQECNHAASVLLSRPKRHLSRRRLSALVADQDRAEFLQRLQSIQSGQADEWQLSLKRGKAETVRVAVRVAVLVDQYRLPRALRWSLRDVPQSGQADAALQQSEARHRFLTEHTQDAIYLFRFTPEPRLDYVSPAIETITGYCPEELYQDWTLLITMIHPKDRWLVEHYAQSVEELTTPTTVRLVHKNGEAVWVEQHTTLIRDESGEPAAVEAIVRDVTERVRTEENLERLRTEFLVVLAHEMRTPLTAIKGSSVIGLSQEAPPKTREAQELFKIIDEQADKLRALMSNLVDVTQIETGLLAINPEEVDACVLLKEACEVFASSAKTHKVVLELSGQLPRLSVDRRRLQQVVINLLSNAAHVSPATEPIVLVAQLHEGSLLVQIRDHGRGIPVEKLPLLFRKFYKVDEIVDKGAGLGLAISKGIIETHGGRIWAESEGKGSGATFNFTLPAIA